MNVLLVLGHPRKDSLGGALYRRWSQLLQGKTAQLLMTIDTPQWALMGN
jgi:putative NADPH-quinone reductase